MKPIKLFIHNGLQASRFYFGKSLDFIDKNRSSSLESFLCGAPGGLCSRFYELSTRFQLKCGRNDPTSCSHLLAPTADKGAGNLLFFF